VKGVKTLHLLRHAKSDWDDPKLSDEQRPLNGRGKRDAKRLARHLELHPITVELVLCSPALRARRTLEAIRSALTGAVSTKEPTIYAAAPDQLFRLVTRLPKGISSVMLVGHNPGFEGLARMLLSADEAPEAFPTCTLATLTFATEDWAAIEPGSAQLAGFLTPNDFQQ
jgi:phosphohistidine phosphatase